MSKKLLFSVLAIFIVIITGWWLLSTINQVKIHMSDNSTAYTQVAKSGSVRNASEALGSDNSTAYTQVAKSEISLTPYEGCWEGPTVWFEVSGNKLRNACMKLVLRDYVPTQPNQPTHMIIYIDMNDVTIKDGKFKTFSYSADQGYYFEGTFISQNEARGQWEAYAYVGGIRFSGKGKWTAKKTAKKHCNRPCCSARGLKKYTLPLPRWLH